MCELFAMSSLVDATVRLSLEEFSRHGGLTDKHRDGWGIAYYEGNDARIFKEAAPASGSAFIRLIQEHPPASHIVVSHIRLATQGDRGFGNCQPFARELGGRMHVFAHNGHLQRDRLVAEQTLGSYRPVGDTDSEHAFCALLERLRPLWLRSEAMPSSSERIEIVAAVAAQLRPLGPANFVYSDGDLVFVHGHRRTQSQNRGILPPGLHLLTRTCAPEGDGLEVKGLRIDAAPARQQVVLIASVPLTDEAGWQPFEEGELVALRRGNIVARRLPSDSPS